MPDMGGCGSPFSWYCTSKGGTPVRVMATATSWGWFRQILPPPEMVAVGGSITVTMKLICSEPQPLCIRAV